jgi:hypothetical protein
LGRPRAAQAIGELYELKEQSMVLQDVCFNVPDAAKEVDMLNALFVDKCKQVRSSKSKEELVAVAAFGPEYYKSPPSFVPGVSDFSQDGGHATISFRVTNTANEDAVELVERGNGLQYVKIGAGNIRLSKAIEKGADIKFAYGWVDLDSPAGVPYQVVVGIARDPLMMACIRVSSVADSQAFFTQQLGMQVLPFPLSRAVGSAFEAAPPKGSVYVGYGESSMGLLLVAPEKNEVVNVGSLLQAFTIVVDNKRFSPQGLPPLGKLLLKDKLLGGESIESKEEYNGVRVQQVDDGVLVFSPDGYPFLLRSLEAFQKTASREPSPIELAGSGSQSKE